MLRTVAAISCSGREISPAHWGLQSNYTLAMWLSICTPLELFCPVLFFLHNTRHNSSCASFLASDDYLPWCSCWSRWRIVLVFDISQTHLCCDPKWTVYQLLISQFWFFDSVIRNRELIYIGEILISEKIDRSYKKGGGKKVTQTFIL